MASVLDLSRLSVDALFDYDVSTKLESETGSEKSHTVSGRIRAIFWTDVGDHLRTEGSAIRYNILFDDDLGQIGLYLHCESQIVLHAGMCLRFDIYDEPCASGWLVTERPIAFYNKPFRLDALRTYFTSGLFYNKISVAEFNQFLVPESWGWTCWLLFHLHRHIEDFDKPSGCELFRRIYSRISNLTDRERTMWEEQDWVYAVFSLLPDSSMFETYRDDLFKARRVLSKDIPKYDAITAILSRNPWQVLRSRLERRSFSISFRLIDGIARGCGFSRNHPERLVLGTSMAIMEVLRSGIRAYDWEERKELWLTEWPGGDSYVSLNALMPKGSRPGPVQYSEFGARFVPKIRGYIGTSSEFSLSDIVTAMYADESLLEVEEADGDRLCYEQNLLKAEKLAAPVVASKIYGKLIPAPDSLDDLIARRSLRKLRGKRFDPDVCETMFRQMFADRGYTPNDKQVEAVRSIFTDEITVITGGPGSGKSTLLGVSAKMMNLFGYSPYVLTTTGQALKNASNNIFENCPDVDFVPLTIAMLRAHAKQDIKFDVEFDGCGKEEYSYESFAGEFVLVDEASMTGLEDMVMVFLLARYARVIIIGDSFQLPPISPGHFLPELFKLAPDVPVITLEGNYRLAGGLDVLLDTFSMIRSAMASGSVVQVDSLPFTPGVFEANFGEMSRDMIDRIVTDYESNVWMYGIEEVICITPMNKYPGGTRHLNKLLQERINPKFSGRPTPVKEQDFQVYKRLGMEIRELRAAGWKDEDDPMSRVSHYMRVGDRVVLTKNSMCKIHGSKSDKLETVANGDTGVIKSYHVNIDSPVNNYVCVQLDGYGSIVEVPSESFDNISLGYAMTVHKAQGSGYKCVMVVYSGKMMGLGSFNSCNMLYTALTRTKGNCGIYGDKRAFQAGLATMLPERKSRLAVRVKEAAETLPETPYIPCRLCAPKAGVPSSLAPDAATPLEFDAEIQSEKE